MKPLKLIKLNNIEVYEPVIVPPTAKRFFEEYLHRLRYTRFFEDEVNIPFEEYYHHEHENDLQDYIAHYILGTKDNNMVTTIFYETTKKHAPAGNALIEIDEIHNVPQVGYTYTNPDFRKRGVGSLRYKLMNTFAKELYGETLHSDIYMQPSAQRIWEKFVREDLARPYKDSYNNQRYKFIE